MLLLVPLRARDAVQINPSSALVASASEIQLPASIAYAFHLPPPGGSVNISLGRSGNQADVNIVSHGKTISRKHCELVLFTKTPGETTVRLSDNETVNGTFIDGRKVAFARLYGGEIVALAGGHGITVGQVSEFLPKNETPFDPYGRISIREHATDLMDAIIEKQQPQEFFFFTIYLTKEGDDINPRQKEIFVPKPVRRVTPKMVTKLPPTPSTRLTKLPQSMERDVIRVSSEEEKPPMKRAATSPPLPPFSKSPRRVQRLIDKPVMMPRAVQPLVRPSTQSEDEKIPMRLSHSHVPKRTTTVSSSPAEELFYVCTKPQEPTQQSTPDETSNVEVDHWESVGMRRAMDQPRVEREESGEVGSDQGGTLSSEPPPPLEEVVLSSELDRLERHRGLNAWRGQPKRLGSASRDP